MAKTLSTMAPLGTPAPHFTLTDAVTGHAVSVPDGTDYHATVLMFICNHCPFVKHINPELPCLANDYMDKGVRFIAINANDTTVYPDDSPENMKMLAAQLHYPFPYLFDETQAVAKAYHAACTPDFFVYDKNLLLVYRGQLDDARPGNALPVNGRSIRTTLDALLANKPIDSHQIPSIGCNIKWKN